MSKEAKDAIGFLLRQTSVSIIVTLLTAFLLVSLALARTIAYLPPSMIRLHILTGVLGVAMVPYTSLSIYTIDQTGWEYTKLANPVFAFADSVLLRDTPEIFTMRTSVDSNYSAAVTDGPRQISIAPRSSMPIRNVLIYVLESVPAEYVDLYGSPYKATPELTKHSGSSLRFDNIYAHVANSPKVLVALLLSTYGMIKYADITSEHPDVPLASLSSELKKRHYRTALFYRSDSRYATQEAFLSHRGFDLIEDDRSRHCRSGVRKDALKEEECLDGSADQCTARSLINWLRRPSTTPFFAILWTMQTHYRYFASSREIDFGVDDPDLNRYLNGLHGSDSALGEVWSALEEEGLIDSALIAVVGDHGESFGRRGHRGHGSSIHVDNVHVPLILMNRRLFDERSSPVFGGLVDVAVAITRITCCGELAGTKSVSKAEKPPSLFFSSWTNVMFGYRDGDRKYVLNATEDRYEIFDLATDPYDTQNLAADTPAERLALQQRLAAWVQYQDKFMSRVTSADTGDLINAIRHTPLIPDCCVIRTEIATAGVASNVIARHLDPGKLPHGCPSAMLGADPLGPRCHHHVRDSRHRANPGVAVRAVTGSSGSNLTLGTLFWRQR